MRGDEQELKILWEHVVDLAIGLRTGREFSYAMWLTQTLV